MANLPKGIEQADLDRALKLDAGIKKLSAELSELKSRIKAGLPEKKQTLVFEGVLLDVSLSYGVDMSATEEKYPETKYPDFWETKKFLTLPKGVDPVKVAKPTVSLSIKPVAK